MDESVVDDFLELAILSANLSSIVHAPLMPTAKERLAHIWPKVDRAKHHIGELEAACREFLDLRPYVVAVKRDADTRRLIYYIESTRSVPLTISTILGDVLNNLRSALDHLAYQLVCVGNKAEGPFIH